MQLISIFTALELRNEINQPGYGVSNVYQDLQLYGEDASATAKWDDIQRDLHCCGGNGYRTGWQAYKNINEWARKRNGVPVSERRKLTLISFLVAARHTVQQSFKEISYPLH